MQGPAISSIISTFQASIALAGVSLIGREVEVTTTQKINVLRGYVKSRFGANGKVRRADSARRISNLDSA